MYENEVLNTYIMYGAVESLVASGLAKNIIIEPHGLGYIIHSDTIKIDKEEADNTIKKIILEGAKRLSEKILYKEQLLNERLDLFQALLRDDWYNNIIKKTLKTIVKQSGAYNPTILSKPEKTPIPLSPYSGKQVTGLYGYGQSGVTHIKQIDLTLSLIGFHYYAPYTYYLDGKTKHHLYITIKPVARTTYDFLCGLKELKTPIIRLVNKTREKDYRINILSLFVRNPSITSYTIATGVPTKLITYEITQTQSVSLRRLEEYDAVRLSSFVYYMKTNDMASFNNFMYNMLRGKPDNQSSVDEKELRNALIEFFYAIVYADYDRLYQSMRKIKRLGFTIPPSTARHMSEWMINALEKTMVPL